MKLLLLIALAVGANLAQARGQNGNGGAGVKRNGTYMTFGSAGLWTDPIPKQTAEVPGLQRLAEILASSQILGHRLNSEITAALLPSDQRKYLIAKEDEFDAATEAKLKAEYLKVIKANAEDLILFAVTDKETKTTFLLPAFFRLSEVEQMAILFHEAYWIMYPKGSYEKVIQAEVAMQKFLENPEDKAAVQTLLKLLYAQPFEQIRVAALMDQDEGIENGVVLYRNEFKILNSRFFAGEEFIKCLDESADYESCSYLLQLHWQRLGKTHWHSSVLGVLSNMVARWDRKFKLSRAPVDRVGKEAAISCREFNSRALICSGFIAVDREDGPFKIFVEFYLH